MTEETARRMAAEEDAARLAKALEETLAILVDGITKVESIKSVLEAHTRRITDPRFSRILK